MQATPCVKVFEKVFVERVAEVVVSVPEGGALIEKVFVERVAEVVVSVHEGVALTR
jgi:hypothetical protein